MKGVLIAIGIVVAVFVLIGLSQRGIQRMEDTTKSTITFTSDPPGATVFVSQYGTFLQEGQTPVEVELENGPHTYRVGFYDFEDEFELYKTYTGKVNVTQDDGISVWLDRRSAEDIADRQRQREEEAAQAQAEQEAELEAQRVYYRIDTNCSSGANLTYFNSNGDITQQGNQGSTWYYGWVPNIGDYLSVSAQNQCDYGYITVKIVRDGVTLQENTSSGAYVIASVDGRWE